MLKKLKFILVMSIVTGCAHTTASEKTPKIAFAVGAIQSIEMRVLNQNERSGTRKNGDIIITNACGHSSTKFDITDSTGGVKTQVIEDTRIGEWCRPPYDFKIGTYFLVVDTNDQTIKNSVPIGNSDALLLDAETVAYWKKEYGELPVDLKWVEFDKPVSAVPRESAYDPYVIAYVNEFDYVKIEEDNRGYQRVVYTHGYKLSDIFTALKPTTENLLK